MICQWCKEEMFKKNGFWRCKSCGHKEVDDRSWHNEKEITKNTN